METVHIVPEGSVAKSFSRTSNNRLAVKAGAHAKIEDVGNLSFFPSIRPCSLSRGCLVPNVIVEEFCRSIRGCCSSTGSKVSWIKPLNSVSRPDMQKARCLRGGMNVRVKIFELSRLRRRIIRKNISTLIAPKTQDHEKYVTLHLRGARDTLALKQRF